MENVCRLCASVKPPDELIYSIEDQYFNFEQKLIECCRWKLFDGYEYEGMPRMFCDDCFKKLENSWEFAESVAQAQEQFLMHMIEIKPPVLLETDTLETSPLIENQRNDQFNDFLAQPNEDQQDFKDIKIFSNSSASFANEFADPVLDDDDYESNPIDDKKTIFFAPLPENVHERLNFIDLLSDCDKNADGTVDLDKILILNLDNWTVLQNKCYVCNGVYANHQSLLSHFDENHSNQPFKYICTICNSLFSKRRGVFRHVTNIHRPYLQYCCKKCNVYYWDLDVLRKHVLGSHKEGYHQLNLCEVCGKCFSNKIKLKNHKRLHLPLEQRQTFECYICKTSFAYKKSLKNHLATHSGEKIKFQCEICFELFSRTDALRRHTLIHLGQTPHQCQVCSKGFRTKFNLKVHERIHTGEKPYACVFCDYRATDAPNLGKHVKMRHRDELLHKHNVLRSVNSS